MNARALEVAELATSEPNTDEPLSALFDDELCFIGGGSPVVNAL